MTGRTMRRAIVGTLAYGALLASVASVPSITPTNERQAPWHSA